jgi:hypothetical protein
MKWTEIALRGVQPIQLGGTRIGEIERLQTSDRNDSLVVFFCGGSRLELPSAVDVSERLACPRVFAIEGTPLDTFLLFGGERIYWLTSQGAMKAELLLFRKWGEEEYWTTEFIEQGGGVIVVYEGGLLAIDEALQVRWHKPKLLNDQFVAMEGNTLKFVRDHDVERFIRLEDGSTAK